MRAAASRSRWRCRCTSARSVRCAFQDSRTDVAQRARVEPRQDLAIGARLPGALEPCQHLSHLPLPCLLFDAHRLGARRIRSISAGIRFVTGLYNRSRGNGDGRDEGAGRRRRSGDQGDARRLSRRSRLCGGAGGERRGDARRAGARAARGRSARHRPSRRRRPDPRPLPAGALRGRHHHGDRRLRRRRPRRRPGGRRRRLHRQAVRPARAARPDEERPCAAWRKKDSPKPHGRVTMGSCLPRPEGAHA
jgi:hypothetical protein